MISYEIEPAAVAEAFAASHQRFWERLANAGTWLTAAERVAVAEEMRAALVCEACARRKAALSPEADVGEHTFATDLPASWRDVIHRIATDPGRLSRAWFDRMVGEDLSPEQYVEIVSTMITVQMIDTFCRGLGHAPHALPTPQAGEPSRYRPAHLVDGEAWVPWIPADGAVGEEADLWSAERNANVGRALSLVPEEIRTLNDTSAVHYLVPGDVIDPRSTGRSLSRIQMELLAARTSALNQCFY